MHKNHNVSMVILNYNDYKTVYKLISNIQNYKVINNIVIVDNCSTDESFEQLLLLSNNKIDVIRTKKNGGYSYGNNIGAKYCIEKYNPNYLIIANPDINIKESTIKSMIERIEKYENIGIIAPKMKLNNCKEYIYGSRLPSFIDNLSYLFISYNKIFGEKTKYKQYEYLDNNIIVDVVPGSLFMIKSKVFENIGMLDEDTFLYCEEMILTKRLKKHNYKNIIMNDDFYIHEHSISIDKSFNSLAKKYKLLINSMEVYNKKYIKVNTLQKIIFKIASKLCIIEKYVISFVNKIIN